MPNKHKKLNTGTINRQLAARIDNMEDPGDYNPYSPAKKAVIHDTELFDSGMYRDDSVIAGDNEYEMSDEKKKDSVMPLILVIVVMAIALCFGIVVLTNSL